MDRYLPWLAPLARVALLLLALPVAAQTVTGAMPISR